MIQDLKGPKRAPRGSRKHVLDWSSRASFADEVIAMASPVGCALTPSSQWMPKGHSAPREARLEVFGPKAMPGHSAWPSLRTWWLKHAAGANTPNWDIALSCLVEGEPGLILVEAKANEPELSGAGKRAVIGSDRSRENHEQISSAIVEAREALSAQFPTIAIDRDRHYQISNRIAFAWKLATLGIPTVLVYLGFLGDTGVANVGPPFYDDDHWQRTFGSHLAEVCRDDICGAGVETSDAKFWLLVRSRPVLEVSPPPERRRKIP